MKSKSCSLYNTIKLTSLFLCIEARFGTPPRRHQNKGPRDYNDDATSDDMQAPLDKKGAGDKDNHYVKMKDEQ